MNPPRAQHPMQEPSSDAPRARWSRMLLGIALVSAGFTVFCLTLFFAAPVLRGQSGVSCSSAYRIDQTLPTGARWEMCWEPRQYDGIVLYDVTYTPPGGPRRLVLAQASLAQVHVPYDDNGARFHDITDYGFGGVYLQNLLPEECPGGTRLVSGGKNMICLQVKPRGYAQKYYSRNLQGYELSLFSVSTSGDYNYIPQWEFFDDGTILPSVGAAGQLQRYGADSTYGWVTGVNRTPISHFHNYWFRLDFDLDGLRDDRVEEIQFNKADSDRRTTIQVTPLTVETARVHDQKVQRSWRVMDTVIKNSEGNPISYHIEGLSSGHDFVGPSFEPFSQSDLYVTVSKTCERYPSHNLRLMGCTDDVTQFVNGENTNGADVVVWYGITFHHLPRSEDETYMDVHWDGFTIIPRDWTASNPLDSRTNSGSQTAMPTYTPTQTATPTPTATPETGPTPTPTSTPVGYACRDVLADGGFEGANGWSFGATPSSASYVTDPVHGGAKSLRTGIPSGDGNTLAYSSVFQRATIPSGATAATFSWWERAGGESDGVDFREALLLDSSYGLLKTLDRSGAAGANLWQRRIFDVSNYAGQTVVVYFNVYNNGMGSQQWNYLDDVSLEACGIEMPPSEGESSLRVEPQQVVMLADQLPAAVAISVTSTLTDAVQNWHASAGAAWLQLAPITGTTPANLTLQVSKPPTETLFALATTETVVLSSTVQPTLTVPVQVVVLDGLENRNYLPGVVGSGEE